MADYCLHCMTRLAADGTCPACANASPVHAPAHVLAPGSILGGRYLVGEALGQGGFGITYMGRDLTLDLRIAIKEYYPSGYVNRNVASSDFLVATGASNEQTLREGKDGFLAEARVLARFHGTEGIVDVRDFFEANNTAYIIMEHLEGRTLKSALAQGAIPARQAFELALPMMRALEKIHAANVVHRDISPDNIMLLDDGTLRLMDFGAARVFDFSDQRTVSMVLKAGYAPEEQYRAKGELGPWTDIYALCATLYKAITGVTPDESLQRMFGDEMKWPSEMGVEIEPGLEAVLKRGMAPLAAERYRSVAEMRADVEHALSESAEHDAATVQAVSAPEPPAGAASTAGGSAAGSEESGATEKTAAPGISTRVAADAHSAPPTPADLADAANTAETSAADSDERDAIAEDVPASAVLIAGTELAAAPSPEELQEPERRKRPIAALATVLVAALAVAAIAIALAMPRSHTVSFDTQGGSEVDAITAPGGQSIEAPADPAREDYIFDGWFYDEGLQQQADFPLEPDEDLVLHAAWKSALTSYTVRYLDKASGKEVADNKVLEGARIGSEASEAPAKVDGYQATSSKKKTITLAEDASANIIKFSYRKVVGYTVEYLERGSGTSVHSAKTVKDALQGDTVTAKAPSVSGYTLVSKEKKTLELTGKTKKNKITFYYTPTPSTPSYSDDSDSASGGYSGGYSGYSAPSGSGGSDDSGGSSSSGSSEGSGNSDDSDSDDVDWANPWAN